MAAHMEAMDSMKNSKLLSAICLAFGSLITAVCVGADVEGGITIGASYTDNVELGTTPNDTDSVIYQASPFFSITHETPNFDTSVNYSFDWYRYDELKSTSKYHRGDVTINGKSVAGYFADGTGRSSQSTAWRSDRRDTGRAPL